LKESLFNQYLFKMFSYFVFQRFWKLLRSYQRTGISANCYR